MPRQEIYDKGVLTCQETGTEDPARVKVTQEVNGYVVWTYGPNLGENPLGFWIKREEAIEHAVDLGRDKIAAQEW